jgi:hypothetical protein
MGAPPGIRRQRGGGARSAPGVSRIADRVRLALRTAQSKLLDSRTKLLTNVAGLRSQLGSRE